MDTSKKIQNIAIIVMAVVVMWFIALLITDNAKASDDADSKEIADLSYQMNELRKQKEKCFDDLTYEESRQSFEWFTKPCVQWDEEIMALREQADKLKAKSYDSLGLE